MIRATTASLQEMADVEQFTRGQYDEADALLIDLKNKVEHEYAGIASQLETMALNGNNTVEDREAVKNTMEFQAEQGSKMRAIRTTLVRKMPAPVPGRQPPNPAHTHTHTHTHNTYTQTHTHIQTNTKT